ncbi:ATP-dependent RNA helicase glh-2-like [Parasteatoda tepidariorum]|uniref:ATP-dependent RNA helicase glh-2-like n=1 Tax=Parasteatoda tepidariorum TaxID=114398 RepID=UPI00077FD764|nr:glycine-rich protein 23-like [Parasteatoda tepidariorum]
MKITVFILSAMLMMAHGLPQVNNRDVNGYNRDAGPTSNRAGSGGNTGMGGNTGGTVGFGFGVNGGIGGGTGTQAGAGK